MKSKMLITIINSKRGFIAFTTVTILSISIITFSLVVMSSVAWYADTVAKRENRIQAKLNTESCLDSLSMMIAKDFFINGEIALREFGCVATISNPAFYNNLEVWNITINVIVNFNNVTWRNERTIRMPNLNM